jgi:tRNA A-37 threonylcarbamoyl transferase component Bud32
MTPTATGKELADADLMAMLQAALAPSFVLVGKIAAGGMGTVYLARDPVLKREVAVKLLSPELAADEAGRARFRREAQAIAVISHPNVVAVHGVGELPNGLPYVVMQFVPGKSIQQRLAEEGPFPLDEVKRIFGDVAAGLAAAHKQGIVHRDVKAANVLWDETTGRALVTDFGVASMADSAGDADALRITQTGTAVGTPAYMSPEQVLGEPVTDRTDVYSLGFLGYELLSGEGPYDIGSPRQIIAAHVRDAPRRVSALRRDVDPEFEAILLKCLDKDPEARPSAEDLTRLVAHGATTLLEWPPPGLEDLRGAAASPTRLALLGALGIVTPLTILAVTDADSVWRIFAEGAVAGTLVTLSAGAFVLGIVRMTKLAFRAATAARAGYSLQTVAEVLADDRGDTGALISGTREYASLALEVRRLLRRRRVLAASLRAAVGPAAVAGFFAGTAIGAATGREGWAVSLLALGVPIAMLVAQRALRRSENRLLAEVRERAARWRTSVESLTGSARSWMASLGKVTEPTGECGEVRGARHRALRLTAGVLLALSCAGIAVTFGTYLIMKTTIADMFDASAGPQIPVRQAVADQMTPLREWRAPIDDGISPTSAGQAAHTIQWAGVPTLAAGLRPPAKPIAVEIAPPGMVSVDGQPVRWIPEGFAKARVGIPARERAIVEELAKLPGAAEFSTIARARSMDILSARYGIPLAGDAPMFATRLPSPQNAKLLSLAHAHAARAILDLAAGNPARAEQQLREIIGAGFTLMDASDPAMNDVGVDVLVVGREALHAFYLATGRTAAAQALLREPNALPDRRILQADVGSARGDAALRFVIDTTLLRGVRWQALRSLATMPCSDLHQVMFGIDDTQRQRLAEARRALVRNAGDNAVFAVWESFMDYPEQLRGPSGVPIPRITMLLAPTSTAVIQKLTGRKGFDACVGPM